MTQFILAIAIVLSTFGSAVAADSFEQVKASCSSSDAVLLDRHGEVIHELRVDRQTRRLEWVKLEDISPALLKAVMHSEDKRFYNHHGVDWKALSSSAVSSLFLTKRRGASTITMQLAALLDGKLRPKRNHRTIGQKWEQIQAAGDLEITWSKEQILEAYLNLVSFRSELVGISAASRGIFDKAPGGLDEAEAAILAALIPSPNASAERVGQRAVLLAATSGINVMPAEISDLAQHKLSGPYKVRKQVQLAPHVAYRMLRKASTRVVSTLDGRLQRFSLDALRQAVGQLAEQNVRDGAVLVVHNRTGDVLAYIGNSGKTSSAQYVDGVQARRQAGSTLKPFLYGLAIDKKIITAASLIEDTPLDIPTERGVYRPENYDKEFRGAVTARTALASSLNIPAVRTLNLVGTDAFVRQLGAFGFTDLARPEHYGPSLALGTADVTLWEMVNAYRTLANDGTWSTLRLSKDDRPTGRHRALTREAAYLISDILSDREARSATFSLESPLATRYWTAVKTGTSKDMRDNWCIGYSDRYTVGVWIGNFSGAAMWDVSGVSGAAPVWLEIMNYLHSGFSSIPSVRPEGVQIRTVSFRDRGKEITKRELFLAGTEQEFVPHRSVEMQPRIIYPAPDTLIAIDPDIPGDLQRIFFETSSADPALQIVLDEAAVGAPPTASWIPVLGKHVLSLIMKDGSIVDHIEFEVK